PEIVEPQRPIIARMIEGAQILADAILDFTLYRRDLRDPVTRLSLRWRSQRQRRYQRRCHDRQNGAEHALLESDLHAPLDTRSLAAFARIGDVGLLHDRAARIVLAFAYIAVHAPVVVGIGPD